MIVTVYLVCSNLAYIVVAPVSELIVYVVPVPLALVSLTEGNQPTNVYPVFAEAVKVTFVPCVNVPVPETVPPVVPVEYEAGSVLEDVAVLNCVTTETL